MIVLQKNEITLKDLFVDILNRMSDLIAIFAFYYNYESPLKNKIRI